jgi:hypothetical protein
VLSWLKAMGSKQAHICMEATGRHSLGVALALYDGLWCKFSLRSPQVSGSSCFITLPAPPAKRRAYFYL